MSRTELWPLIRETSRQYWGHKGPRIGAALAFYTSLSLSPLLVVVVAIGGFAYGEAAARGEVAHQIRNNVGEEGAQAIQSILAEHRSIGTGILMTTLGVITLIIGASGVFAELQDAIDTIWDFKPPSSGGVIGAIRDRFMAFSVVGAVAFLLLASLVFSALMSAASRWTDAHLAVASPLVQIGNQLLSFVLTTSLFAMIFKILPHARPRWSDVWTGALITAIMFTLGKYLIGLYLGQAMPGSAYGVAGSFVVLLVWIYYSTQILLFGAEFTHVYAQRRGSPISSRTFTDEPSTNERTALFHTRTVAN